MNRYPDISGAMAVARRISSHPEEAEQLLEHLRWTLGATPQRMEVNHIESLWFIVRTRAPEQTHQLMETLLDCCDNTAAFDKIMQLTKYPHDAGLTSSILEAAKRLDGGESLIEHAINHYLSGAPDLLLNMAKDGYLQTLCNQFNFQPIQICVEQLLQDTSNYEKEWGVHLIEFLQAQGFSTEVPSQGYLGNGNPILYANLMEKLCGIINRPHPSTNAIDVLDILLTANVTHKDPTFDPEGLAGDLIARHPATRRRKLMGTAALQELDTTRKPSQKI